MISPGRKEDIFFPFQPKVLIKEVKHFRFNKFPNIIQAGKKSKGNRINDKRRQFLLEKKSQIKIKGKEKMQFSERRAAGYISIIRIFGLALHMRVGREQGQ